MLLFAFTCYLFKDQTSIGGDSFVNRGFGYWNMRTRHVGETTSYYNNAKERYNYFAQPKSLIQGV
jgi:hypothetical protein